MLVGYVRTRLFSTVFVNYSKIVFYFNNETFFGWFSNRVCFSFLGVQSTIAKFFFWSEAHISLSTFIPSESHKLQVAFDLVVNDNLGLMIRGGIEYGLGIFITGVDQESAAFRNGLRVRSTFLPQCVCKMMNHYRWEMRSFMSMGNLLTA